MHKLALVVVVVGSAIASSAPATKSRPVISFEAPTVSGSLDAKALDAVVKATKPKLLACFAKVAGDEVEATVTFAIGNDGKVTNAETAGPSDDVADCITATFLKLKFAASKATTGVVYPFAFARLGSPQILGTNPIGGGSGDISSSADDPLSYGNEATSGHASGVGGGTGSGYDVAPLVLISLGEATTSGDLDKAIIRRYIKRNVQKLQYCYEKELLAKKTLQGTITAAFTITAQGSVGTSTATGMKNKTVESCVASVIHDIEFPKPHDGNEVTVSYPFTFKPPPAKKTK